MNEEIRKEKDLLSFAATRGAAEPITIKTHMPINPVAYTDMCSHFQYVPTGTQKNTWLKRSKVSVSVQRGRPPFLNKPLP